jgi:hypothetical protein
LSVRASAATRGLETHRWLQIVTAVLTPHFCVVHGLGEASFLSEKANF